MHIFYLLFFAIFFNFCYSYSGNSGNTDKSCPVQPTCRSMAPYRTIDGTCNNMRRGFELQGSAGMIYRREIPAEYGPNDSPRGGYVPNSILPNERLVSTTIHNQRDAFDFRFSQMFMNLGEYMVHDIILTHFRDDLPLCCVPEEKVLNPPGVCIEIQVPQNDSHYTKTTCLERKRNFVFCPEMSNGVRQQINVQSAYIDSSHVYGPTIEIAAKLREFIGGRLIVGQDDILPLKEDVDVPVELIPNTPLMVSGDVRTNINPGIAALHTIWVREHNRIANELSSINSNLNDEQLYQEARRIAIAEFQNIIYSEYLKALLTSDHYENIKFETNDRTLYNRSVDATIDINLPGGALRMGHSMINNQIHLVKDGEIIGSYKLRDVIFRGGDILNSSESLDNILEGLAHTFNQRVDPAVSNEVRNHFMGNGDLISANIARGRDLGIPNFNKLREFCHLPPIRFNRSATDNGLIPDAFNSIRSLYQNPDMIDIFTGGLSEIPLENGVLGPTFSCLIKDQFERLKFGDRFFFTHRNVPTPFTISQIENIKQRRLFDVICENTNIKNLPPSMLFRANSQGNSPISCENTNKLDFSIFI